MAALVSHFELGPALQAHQADGRAVHGCDTVALLGQPHAVAACPTRAKLLSSLVTST